MSSAPSSRARQNRRPRKTVGSARGSKKKYFILSIDGGGIRGIIPLRALDYLQTCLHQRNLSVDLTTHFDTIAGTSTGAIIAAGLCCPSWRPGVQDSAYTVPQMLEIYNKRGAEIFNGKGSEQEVATWSSWMLGKFTGLPAKYKHDEDAIETILSDIFRDKKVADSKTHLLVTAFDLKEMAPVIISSDRDRGSFRQLFHDYLFTDAVRASSSAPTYFRPKSISLSDLGIEQVLIDGGVFANNPCMLAYIDAIQRGYRPEDIYIFSLGTGSHFLRTKYANAQDWQLHDWMDPKKDVPIMTILLDAHNRSTVNMMKRLFPSNFFRIDGEIGQIVKLDETNEATLQSLNDASISILEENSPRINEFVGILAANCAEA